ncbi:MAG TPA: deaminase [Candidatus Saccharimonadales bacterium]|nr:deaminase [Candidatus Saccharimonadales bacterium]
MAKSEIKYPFIPKDETIYYVDGDNKFMSAAREFARSNSLDRTMPTASVIVLEGKIIGRGANGSDYHDKFGCERVKKGIPTGQRYELCEGCHPKNHSEPRAIVDALHNHPKKDLSDGELYLWGHWWACEPCWNAILAAGIKKVYLEKNSHKLYNKKHLKNIVGRQFA